MDKVIDDVIDDVIDEVIDDVIDEVIDKLIQIKIIHITLNEQENIFSKLERNIESSVRMRLETKKLNDAIKSKDIKTLRLLAGECDNPCRLYDDIECYKCISSGSYDPVIKQNARMELDRIL